MKILRTVSISAMAILLMNFLSFAQSQSYKGDDGCFFSDGSTILSESSHANFASGNGSQLSSKTNLYQETANKGVKENDALPVLSFQQIKAVSDDFMKNNIAKKNFIKLKTEDETTYKKKSSFWTSDLLYFTAGVVAATAAYFLISGTSAATSSQKTFGYPPPPSN